MAATRSATPSDHRPVLRSISGFVRRSPTLGRLTLRCIPDARWTIRIEPIGPFEIRLRRHRSFWIRHPLTLERTMFAGMARLIPPGAVALDVGGNIGLYARFMAQAFGASRVVTFEPMTANRVQLERNIRLGGCEERVVVLPYALSDRDGEADLQIDNVHSASAALDDVTHGRPSEGHEHYGLPAQTERVPTRTLDGLIAGGEAPPPGFIKVDIEGAEAMFLRGAARTLRDHRPRLAIELHGLPVAIEVLDLLSAAGYACWSHVQHPDRAERTWEHVTPDTARSLTGHYAMHFVFAEPTEAQPVLRAPLEPWYPGAAHRD